MDPNREQLWKDYRESRDDRSVVHLMNSYVSHLKGIAEEIASEHPGTAPQDDLISAASMALHDCIETYPVDCPIAFEDYCRPAIEQAMLRR